VSHVSAHACAQAARTITPELERAGSESKSNRTPVNTRTLLPSTLRNAYRFPIRLRSSPMSGRASASKPSRCSHRIAAVYVRNDDLEINPSRWLCGGLFVKKLHKIVRILSGFCADLWRHVIHSVGIGASAAQFLPAPRGFSRLPRRKLAGSVDRRDSAGLDGGCVFLAAALSRAHSRSLLRLISSKFSGDIFVMERLSI
jgi:hypothetical protein